MIQNNDSFLFDKITFIPILGITIDTKMVPRYTTLTLEKIQYEIMIIW